MSVSRRSVIHHQLSAQATTGKRSGHRTARRRGVYHQDKSNPRNAASESSCHPRPKKIPKLLQDMACFKPRPWPHDVNPFARGNAPTRPCHTGGPFSTNSRESIARTATEDLLAASHCFARWVIGNLKSHLGNQPKMEANTKALRLTLQSTYRSSQTKLC